MKAIYFTQNADGGKLLGDALNVDGVQLYTVTSLNQLERAFRIRFPNMVIIDCHLEKDKKKLERYLDIIYCCVGICLNARALYLFDGFELTQYFLSDFHRSYLKRDTRVERLAINVKLRIQKYTENHETLFRPCERKIYQLLKNTKHESISLEYMSEVLWGSCSIAHKKTLYSYICRIKQILNENRDIEEWLIKEKKGYYKISIAKPVY